MFWDFCFILGVFGGIVFVLETFYFFFKCFLFLVYHFLDDGELGFFDYLKQS